MAELLIALLTVLAALLVHVILWKIRVPLRQTRAILIIFFGMFCITLAGLPALASYAAGFGLNMPLDAPTFLHLVCFVTAAALSYMMTYTVIEVDSPSLVMTLAISRAGKTGMPEEDFHRMMDNALLVEPRIRDMVRDGLVMQSGDSYILTDKGRRMVRLFILHRTLLGAGKGG